MCNFPHTTGTYLLNGALSSPRDGYMLNGALFSHATGVAFSGFGCLLCGAARGPAGLGLFMHCILSLRHIYLLVVCGTRGCVTMPR